MKKILNRPESFVEEMTEGIAMAYGHKIRFLDAERRILLRAQPAIDKVGIVTAGGSGHLPVFLGYVGQGMLDGCALGNVFASPSAKKMEEMIRACDTGKGVLCLYGNYGGDCMNFDMACDMLEMDDIVTKTVLVCDDVASAPADKASKRRGVAGMVYAFKIAGAAAEQGRSLDAVASIAEKSLAHTRSMGVALSPCIVPEVGKPSFSIGDDEIEVGMGIHGEPGIEVCKMMTADQIAETLFAPIMQELSKEKGDKVSVMVNGLGATPMEELFIVYRRLHQLFSEHHLEVVLPHIGEFATSMEMAGLSVTVIRLDSELEALLKEPAVTPFYTNLNLL